MDRRSTPATKRVAHSSLKGKVEAPRYSDGEFRRVAQPLVDLLSAPRGGRERQLWLGDGFTALDHEEGYVFGFASKDGYCGWLPEAALSDGPKVTHWVASPGTHLYPQPKVQAPEIAALPMGARVEAIGVRGNFTETTQGFVPSCHLLPIGTFKSDPVAVAEAFLGTPYLWGGNSRAGIDCSGLVQMALLACGRPCPGDADQQEALGVALPDTAPLRRGDLVFWKGHVAMVVDESRLIHANGHSMSVAYEPTAACIARIQATDGSPLRSRRRINPPA